MLKEIGYHREATLLYAKRWALSRNPHYFDFEHLGGDCTNFASQCIYAGSNVMNYTPTMGWYYNSIRDRTPSWTGVQYLYNFLVKNKSVGPYAVETDQEHIQPGDIVQLGNSQEYYHSPVIVAIEGGRIYLAAHTIDAYMRPLDTYVYERARFLHIEGVRKWQ
ncbi:amidase domain-containing protein [Anaerosporobacter faecicola]|uniref:amidase domain-containing protein n=1 Tax=Anaerosporobacter faecicola TaxID=2718714 RepID=UPI00143CBECE|nr:amidase domain-containing protein [Anaerosporobacter faecicola]